jgi:predicted acyl esterase
MAAHNPSSPLAHPSSGALRPDSGPASGPDPGPDLGPDSGGQFAPTADGAAGGQSGRDPDRDVGLLSGAQRWRLPGKRPVRVVEHVWIAMPDGVRLSARLFLPEEPGGAPTGAVFEYIPYRKRDIYRAIDDAWGVQLAQRGFAFVRVDVRGSGESEGVMTDEYSDAELTDGMACIAWIARQHWCTGAVGMRGLSWGGINALQIAAMAPPALKAIMPMGCCDNRYTDDAHYLGGALAHANLQWGVSFKTVMAGPPDPGIVGADWERMWRERLEATPAIIASWMEHQRYDDYWRRGSIETDYSAIRCPVYVVAGWQDTYSNPVGRLLEKLTSPRKALIGPWGHTYPAFAQPLALDWIHEEARWWAQWLHGEDTGIMEEPMFRAFLAYATARETSPEPVPGRWIEEARWPPASVAARQFHLNAEGLGARAGSDGVRLCGGGRVVGLAKSEWLDRLPLEQSCDDDRSLCFDTPPLVEEFEALGYPRIAIRVRADKPQATLAVRLNEVTPDGRSWLVSYGVRNLSHRDGHELPSALAPGVDYDVAFDLFMIAHRFRVGSRIRVAISESLWPLVWPSPEPVTLAISLGVSTLTLPARTPEPLPSTMAIPVRLAPLASAAPAPAPPEPDAQRRYVMRTDAPASTSVIVGLGTRIERARFETSEIREADPVSCMWRQETHVSWTRGEWACALVAACEITGDAVALTISETLIARAHGAIIFERATVRTQARDCL